MSTYESRFEQLRSTGHLDATLSRWKERHPYLDVLEDSEVLLSTLQSRDEGKGALKREVLLAVCAEVRAGDEDAFLLLVGRYIPAFRKLRGQIGACAIGEEDLEAEMIAGFWEAISNVKSLTRNPAAALFRGPQHRVWKAVARASRERKWTHEPENEASTDAVHDGEPFRLIDQAVDAGVLEASEAALILATRIGQEPVAELAHALGAGREALSMRRKRAERKLAAWLQRDG